MKKIKVFIACLGILFGYQTIFAQSPSNPLPDWVRRNEQKRAQMEKLNKPVSDEVLKGSGLPRTTAQKKQQELEEEEKRIIIDEINAKLSPPAEYTAEYAVFLKEKNTGITRMFPDKNCGMGLVVSVKELERCGETPQIKGAGSLYSTRLDAIPGYLPLGAILSIIGLSEIHFVGEKLIIGNDLTQGIIGEIGDANIDEIDLKSDAFKFLTKYERVETKSDFALKTAELERGIESGGFFYSASARVRLNSVYVLRSIAYWQKYKSFWNTDVFVVFKIIGQEKDGSIIFIWKKLKDKDAPELTNK
ncbi:MAG TPA: hypothetical protein VGC76_17890 [Pyrinomonadaceae bacterium]|jgi:hypothetical protein